MNRSNQRFFPSNGKPVKPYSDNRTLSRAEHEVLNVLLAFGGTNREIGVMLGKTEEQVRGNLKQIMDKTGYSTRCELIVNIIHKRYEAQGNKLQSSLIREVTK